MSTLRGIWNLRSLAISYVPETKTSMVKAARLNAKFNCEKVGEVTLQSIPTTVGTIARPALSFSRTRNHGVFGTLWHLIGNHKKNIEVRNIYRMRKTAVSYILLDVSHKGTAC